jgi:hypothetical protein
MKKTILLLLLLIGVAYYLHWFNFTTEGTGTNEHINITLDKTKIAEDEAKAVRVLKDEEQRIAQDAAQGGEVAPNRQSAGQSSYDPNGAPRRAEAWQPGKKIGYDPNGTPSGAPTYDPYDPNPPVSSGNGRIAPRSAKRPPPSDLDRGFE